MIHIHVSDHDSIIYCLVLIDWFKLSLTNLFNLNVSDHDSIIYYLVLVDSILCSHVVSDQATPRREATLGIAEQKQESQKLIVIIY
jgi:hypothetical protein